MFDSFPIAHVAVSLWIGVAIGMAICALMSANGRDDDATP